MPLYRITLVSEEYGYDEFDYATRAEALAGKHRLIVRTKDYEKSDGVHRTIEGPFEVEEEQEAETH